MRKWMPYVAIASIFGLCWFMYSCNTTPEMVLDAPEQEMALPVPEAPTQVVAPEVVEPVVVPEVIEPDVARADEGNEPVAPVDQIK